MLKAQPQTRTRTRKERTEEHRDVKLAMYTEQRDQAMRPQDHGVAAGLGQTVGHPLRLPIPPAASRATRCPAQASSRPDADNDDQRS